MSHEVETWYAEPSGTHDLNNNPGFTMTYFTARSKLHGLMCLYQAQMSDERLQDHWSYGI